MVAATGAENAPLAEGEIPAAFACVLELCTEPAIPAPAAPVAVMAGTSQPPAAVPRRAASRTSSPEDGEAIEPDALPLATTVRSFRQEPPCAPVETTGRDDAESAVVCPVAEEADAPAEVPVEIMSLAVSLPIPLPVPQPTVAHDPIRSAARTGPERGNDVVDEQLQSDAGPALTPPRTAIFPPAAAPAVRDELPVTDAPAASFSAEVTELPAPRSEEDVSPLPKDRFLQVAAKKQGESAPHTLLEKIAAPVRPVADRPVISASRSTEYKFLKTDD